MGLKAPSTLLMGAPGSGKTTAGVTFAKAGIETFFLLTEPNGEESIIDAAKLHGVDIKLLHWHTVSPASPGWDALMSMATTIKAMSYEDIAKIKQGVGKTHQVQLEKLLRAIQNFPCDRTGKTFGDVTTWGPERAFIFDGLSGFNMISMLQTVGYKPSAHQGEWGIAMNLEEQVIHKLTSDCACFFALMAHIDRELEEISGRSIVTPAALGRKLGPRLGRFFSEVVLTKRMPDGKFVWSTTDSNAELKNRALPISSTIAPDFSQIVRAFRQRSAAIALPPSAAAE